MQKNQKSSLFEGFDGLVLINKPAGISSYDAIRKLKQNFFFLK